MQICDTFDLVELEAGFAASVKEKLAAHCMFTDEQVAVLDKNAEFTEESLKAVVEDGGCGLYFDGRIVGVVKKAHDVDVNLSAHVMLENISSKATSVLSLLHLIRVTGIDPAEVDYVIDCANDMLTEEIIKKLHFILKHDTKDSTLDWFAVGDYKKRPNVVGGRETTKPKNVPTRMKSLLDGYNAKQPVTINDIIAFHAEFEQIHPFQDGNGRVGRLIALKECLRHNIVPFLIEDRKKMFYYRGLSEWNNEKGWLTDTCLDGQDTFKRLLAMFES
jgi:hypothetical protein